MKQLQIPIEDELMKKLKQIALENDTTLKAMVTAALEEWVESVKNDV